MRLELRIGNLEAKTQELKDPEWKWKVRGVRNDSGEEAEEEG